MPVFSPFLPFSARRARPEDASASLFRSLLPTAADSRVKAAYGVDPVDNTDMTPVGPAYPSAVAALNGTGLPMGFTGATRTSMCNPKSANYQARRADHVFATLFIAAHAGDVLDACLAAV